MNNNSNNRPNRLISWCSTFAVVLFLWVILSGIFEAKMLLLGVFSAAVVATISAPILTLNAIKSDKEYFVFAISPKIIPYFFWLVKEIILAAWDVTKTILFNRDQIDSAYCRFKADYDNPIARSTLTDSITLTPGTITVNVDDNGVYTVHGLTQAARDSLLEGGMQMKVAETFGETIDFEPMESRIQMPTMKLEKKNKVSKSKVNKTSVKKVDRGNGTEGMSIFTITK